MIFSQISNRIILSKIVSVYLITELLSSLLAILYYFSPLRTAGPSLNVKNLSF